MKIKFKKKTKENYGIYYWSNDTAYISVEQTPLNIVKTIIHEMVHSQQPYELYKIDPIGCEKVASNAEDIFYNQYKHLIFDNWKKIHRIKYGK